MKTANDKIMENPNAGAIMRGGGGIRKLLYQFINQK
jgi:hypothetical protein